MGERRGRKLASADPLMTVPDLRQCGLFAIWSRRSMRRWRLCLRSPIPTCLRPAVLVNINADQRTGTVYNMLSKVLWILSTVLKP